MLGKIRKWFRRDDGAAAIEFSMLVFPYIMISLGIIELSLMMLTGSLLEGATNKASRLIKTGQIQKSESDHETMFRDALCDASTFLVKCEDMVVEVMPLNSYGDYTEAAYDADGNMQTTGFDAGGSNDKVLIRVSFRYEMITPVIGPLLNGPDGGTVFVSTIVIQSEPYEFQGA